MPSVTSTPPLEDEEAQGGVGCLSRAPMMPESNREPVHGYIESACYAPHWGEFQEPDYSRQRVTARSAVFGGLAGGIFFFGLAAAILSGHFWPVFLVTLALTALLGPLGSSKAQAIYGGFQGCVFFLGLAVCSIYDWWWPGILVLLGIEAILGIGNALLPGASSDPPGRQDMENHRL